MTPTTAATELRPALTLELDLGGGARAASARVELAADAAGAVARVAVRGWIGRVAEQRLMGALGEWMGRGIERVILDCRDAHHLNARTVHRLAQAAARREGGGAVEIWGLPRRSGSDGRARAGAVPVVPGSSSECGS
jgi:hypothetical protein